MLSDRETLEAMIRLTGGIEVRIGNECTWGHRGTRYIEVGGPEVDTLMKATTVKVPAEVVPENPVDAVVTMCNTSYKVRSVESDEEDGAMSVLILRKP